MYKSLQQLVEREHEIFNARRDEILSNYQRSSFKEIAGAIYDYYDCDDCMSDPDRYEGIERVLASI